MSQLRVVYAGTPEFATKALESILAAGYEVPLVLTQPDRPSGRGMKLQPSAVKKCALLHGLDVLQPSGLRLDGRYALEAQKAQKVLQEIAPDIMVVAAYGLILPQWVLDLPRLGCLNIHASLLPRWRGAAPIHRAIEAGDIQTGVTIMQMDAGLDTGDMLLTQAIDISSQDTTGSLHDKLAAVGAGLVVQALADAKKGLLQPKPQPDDGVSYAHKIEKMESKVNWQLPAIEIERRIRAFDPFPGVIAQYADQTLKIWQAQALPDEGTMTEGEVGQIVAVHADSLVVATGCGYLQIMQMQRPGGKRQPVREMLQNLRFQAGECLS